ncbi:MAG: type II toxin-antitoxin system RelE family toxin [Terriglobales bacterium]
MLAKSAQRYLDTQSQNTQQRILDRLRTVAAEPANLRFSKPLAGAGAIRSAHVGGWRILLEVIGDEELRVYSIAPRGQVYQQRRIQRLRH